MTPREAIKMLDDSTAALNCNRQTQFAILDALKVIAVLIDEKEARDAIAADQAKKKAE
jgi:hypothetical protein